MGWSGQSLPKPSHLHPDQVRMRVGLSGSNSGGILVKRYRHSRNYTTTQRSNSINSDNIFLCTEQPIRISVLPLLTLFPPPPPHTNPSSFSPEKPQQHKISSLPCSHPPNPHRRSPSQNPNSRSRASPHIPPKDPPHRHASKPRITSFL